MKKLLTFLIVFVFLMLPCAVFAANQYGCTALTGGGSGALDALDITGASTPNADNLAEGDTAIVPTISGSTVLVYRYIFDASGTDAESSPTIIRPDDYSTAGVWRLAVLNASALPDLSASYHGVGGTDVPVTDGGTNSSTAAGARTNLGLVIGTDVQAYNASTDTDNTDDITTGSAEISTITEKASPVSADLILIEDSAAANAKKRVQIGNLPSSGGDITGVLGDTTGDVPVLFQTFTSFSAADATPNVSGGSHFETVDTTTITDFDGTPVDGQHLWVLCGAATVFDFTASGLEGVSSDYTCTAEEILHFIYSTGDNQWHLVTPVDEYATISTNGILVRTGSGTATSRSITTSSAGMDVTNGDGVSGNPSVDLDVTPSSGSSTLIEEEDALQVKYIANDFDESASGLGIDYTNGQKASTSQAGFCTEMATAAEINTGTDAARCASPDAIAGSTYGTVFVTLRAFAPGTALATGDGADYWTVPPELNGWNLVSVFGAVYTVSSSGTPTFQVHNLTDTQDMLSTTLTIDASEFNSSTAATAAVINASFDDVATGDRIRLDVDVAGTSTAGGDVILGFRLP